MIYLLIFLFFFLLVALFRVPVFLAMMAGAVITILVAGLKLQIIGPSMFNGSSAFVFLAIPAFMCAGELMSHGGISSAILSLTGVMLQRFRGTLGSVVIVTSMLFGTITGSSLATIAAVGGMTIPEMLKTGYSKEYTTALVAAAGFLGILIPPSIPGVIYAVTANQSVAAVWLATLVPGLILGGLYIIANYIIFGRKQKKIDEPFKVNIYLSQVAKVLPKATIAMLVPVVIFVGVYGGIFTPTEAGAASVLVGAVIAWGIYPKFFKVHPNETWYNIAAKAAMGSAGIMMIIAVAHIVSVMMAYAGIAAQMVDFVLSVTDNPIIFLIMVNLMLLLVGMFLEINTSILLFAPILIPMAQVYGINPIHFAAIVLLNLNIGMITPPFAVNLFAACKLTGVPMNRVIKPLLPFLACCIVTLILVTYIPGLSMFFNNM